jgi:hypothetical protein
LNVNFRVLDMHANHEFSSGAINKELERSNSDHKRKRRELKKREFEDLTGRFN